MEQRRRKRILYIICFSCLALIDFVRGSQKWEYWVTAINLTGVFVSIVMMSHFCWKKESPKPYFAWTGIWMIGSLIGHGIWKEYSKTRFTSQYWAAAIAILFVGIVAVRVWRERKDIFRNFRKIHILPLCWIVLSVLILCSRMREIWPMWYVVIFGLFYSIPFTAEERRDLWNGLADGLIVTFFLLQIYAYGFRPYDELRYSGAYENCNMNALFYMVTYIALLYRSHSLRWQERLEGDRITWKRRCRKLFLWVLTVGIWGFVFLTMTRTALLMLIILTLVYTVVEFAIIFREKVWRLLLRGFAFVVGIVFIFPAVYTTVRWLPTILHHPIWYGAEYSVYKIHSYDPPNSEKYITMEEVLEGLLGRLGVELLEIQNEGRALTSEYPLLASAEVSGRMLPLSDKWISIGDDVYKSEARLVIFKMYLQNLNFAGHELEEGYFPITSTYHAWHAQNVFIQVAFYYGILSGILFVVLVVGLGIQAAGLVFRRHRCEDLLPLLVMLLFVGYGMLECVWYPGQSILLLMYLIPKILSDSRRELREIK